MSKKILKNLKKTLAFLSILEYRPSHITYYDVLLIKGGGFGQHVLKFTKIIN